MVTVSEQGKSVASFKLPAGLLDPLIKGMHHFDTVAAGRGVELVHSGEASLEARRSTDGKTLWLNLVTFYHRWGNGRRQFIRVDNPDQLRQALLPVILSPEFRRYHKEYVARARTTSMSTEAAKQDTDRQWNKTARERRAMGIRGSKRKGQFGKGG